MYIVNPFIFAGRRFYDTFQSYDEGGITYLTSGITYSGREILGYRTGYFIPNSDAFSYDTFDGYTAGLYTIPIYMTTSAVDSGIQPQNWILSGADY